MSNQPKANWSSQGSKTYWTTFIGTYHLHALSDEGSWFVEHCADDADLNIRGNCGTPCDVVTLMLAAESALATHLRSVADTMIWPEEPVAEPAPYALSALPPYEYRDWRATAGTWAWAEQQLYAGAQICRRDPMRLCAPRVLGFADLGVFDNATDHAATNWELFK